MVYYGSSIKWYRLIIHCILLNLYPPRIHLISDVNHGYPLMFVLILDRENPSGINFRGRGLDVFATEPIPADDAILKAEPYVGSDDMWWWLMLSDGDVWLMDTGVDDDFCPGHWEFVNDGQWRLLVVANATFIDGWECIYIYIYM